MIKAAASTGPASKGQSGFGDSAACGFDGQIKAYFM
jgi:hypothetical protein